MSPAALADPQPETVNEPDMSEWIAQKKTYRPGASESGTVNSTCELTGSVTCSQAPSDEEKVCRVESRLMIVNVSPGATSGAAPNERPWIVNVGPVGAAVVCVAAVVVGGLPTAV